MRKSSTYAKKRSRDAWQRERYKHVNPVKQEIIQRQIKEDIERLRTGAALHAYTGANIALMGNLVGRLVFVTCYAARIHGLNETPEARILAGTANALGDLVAGHDIERQRASIIAGLGAIDRLMPQLHTMSLAAGALELDKLLAQANGMGTHDVFSALAMDPI